MRILYVDDDHEFQTLVTAKLKQHFGVTVDLASSGNEAIALLTESQGFDLVIADYQMPDGDGADVYNFMVSRNIPGLFILFTSQNIDSDLKSKFRGNRIHGIISKPNLRQLCTAMVKSLSRL